MSKSLRFTTMLGVMIFFLCPGSSVYACQQCIMIQSYDLLRFSWMWIGVFIIWTILALVAGISLKRGQKGPTVFVFAGKPLMLVFVIMPLLILFGLSLYAVLVYPLYLLPYLVKPFTLKSQSALYRSNIAPKWFRTVSKMVLIIMVGSIPISYFIFPYVYIEAETRQLVSTTRSTMRKLSAFIEEYHKQYGVYPYSVIVQSDHSQYNTIDIDALKRVARYLSDRDLARIMEDRFSTFDLYKYLAYEKRSKIRESFRYSSKDDRYILWSSGPDGIYEPDLPRVAIEDKLANRQDNESLLNVTYDCTNGTNSPGDIIIVGSR